MGIADDRWAVKHVYKIGSSNSEATHKGGYWRLKRNCCASIRRQRLQSRNERRRMLAHLCSGSHTVKRTQLIIEQRAIWTVAAKLNSSEWEAYASLASSAPSSSGPETKTSTIREEIFKHALSVYSERMPFEAPFVFDLLWVRPIRLLRVCSLAIEFLLCPFALHAEALLSLVRRSLMNTLKVAFYLLGQWNCFLCKWRIRSVFSTNNCSRWLKRAISLGKGGRGGGRGSRRGRWHMSWASKRMDLGHGLSPHLMLKAHLTKYLAILHLEANIFFAHNLIQF